MIRPMTRVVFLAALAAASLAEASAARTANAAKLMVEATRTDLADADVDVATAVTAEEDAHERYRQASNRATERSSGDR